MERGDRFNNLVYTGEKIYSESKRWLGIFDCDCGKTFHCRIDYVKSGRHKRCSFCNRNKHSNKIKQSNDNYSFYIIWNRVKKRAKKANIIFKLTVQDIEDVYNNQNGKCIYTKYSLSPPDDFQYLKKCNLSVDRIDSNKDYTKDNIQLTCKLANMMKHELSHEQFIKLCHIVGENNE